MIEHADIVPVMTKAQRLKAVGTEADFPEDVVTTYVTKYCEEIFEPKRVLTPGDWLKTTREPDQYFSNYKAGKGNIKWVNAQKNKIYLVIPDKTSFTDTQIA